MNRLTLHQHLDALYQTFDISYLSPDPLEIVRRYRQQQDQEIVGLIASCLAYGQVSQIIRAVEAVLNVMGNSPSDFVREFDIERDGNRFRNFNYRFTKANDVVCLISSIYHAISDYGSIGKLFEYCIQESDSIRDALSKFIRKLKSYLSFANVRSHSTQKGSGIRYLLPDPEKGGACKRLNLFLRWMVRKDNIDLGLWNFIRSDQLIIPLDTHVFRISYNIGLTNRKTANWKCAQEITDHLKIFDPNDPVKYDFSISRMGILHYCPKIRDIEKCHSCQIQEVCRL